MIRKLLSLFFLLFAVTGSLAAQDFVNLTPRPKQMTVGKGSLPLPQAFSVAYAGSDEAMTAEVSRFAAELSKTTGLTVSATTDEAAALVKVVTDKSLKTEGAYKLSVTAEGATVTTADALGLFYAFQTIKKVLPANVMAGVADARVTGYALPLVTINDAPRFAYRGFMLDVARHFFTVDEVKRMIDVMAYYKMNRFHWHLSDDQGWRVEIKKYPKLTTIGATAPNSWFTDMYTRTNYWINKPYGPYFYTQDQIREVVAYAKERHIEIIPEIDMPGHFVAALAAYPEFSCHPSYAPTVWSTGGISSDVLNVANPQAVQFAKNILSELIDLFPYEYIHIGGDECPTNQWQTNADCQKLYKELGLTDYRQLQSHFISDLGKFVAEKGRKLSVWNEAITASGADTKLVKETEAVVYCWTGPEAAAKKAKQLGLQNIYTPWGPYYINRKQGNSELDPPGAGYGTDDVKATYNQAIPSETDYGVQGTFWCEHVSDRDYMEWLALPRLIAIAEAGWTPQAQRSFTDFQKRMTADTTLLNYGGYKYCTYHMLMENNGYPVVQKTLPKASTADKAYYYRLISGGTDATRKDRCIELLADGSPLISQYSGKGAKAGVLWTNAQAAAGDANYAAQWWTLEADPAGSGKYAIVNKSQPAGSVKPDPSATSTSGRWSYDNNAKHYNFTLGAGAYGKVGDNYYYSISSDKVSGQYWNSSMAGQGLAVNVYSNPGDGAGGQWQFSPLEAYGWEGGGTGKPITFDGLTEGKTYTFTNDVEGFAQTALTDTTGTTALTHSAYPFAQNAWTVTKAGKPQTDGTQTLTLTNAATGRTIAAVGNYVSNQGFPVTMGSKGAELTLAYDTLYKDYRLKVSGKSLFPLPAGTVNAGSNVQGASYDAPRLQGAAWRAVEVRVVTFTCKDEAGTTLATVKRSVPVSVTDVTAALAPTFKNMEAVGIEAAGADAYTVTYKRIAYSLVVKAIDSRGALISVTDHAVPVGESFTFTAPKPAYYTLTTSEVADGTVLTPEADRTVTVTYETDAISGVKALGDRVTEGLKNGQSYVLYDASPADGGARKGYRKITEGNGINRATSVDGGLDPTAVWTLEGAGKSFKVKNEYKGLYVPSLGRSQAAVASTSGGTFTFTLNASGTDWCIKGTNGMMWDGLADGNLVGWAQGTGHPIEIYTYFAQPYYTVTVTCVDEADKVLSTQTDLVMAGDPYPLVLPAIDGYTLKSATGNEGYEGTVEGFVTVKAVYAPDNATGIEGVTVPTGQGAKTIYDLQGRRLQRVSTPGIYVINGRKVLVK